MIGSVHSTLCVQNKVDVHMTPSQSLRYLRVKTSQHRLFDEAFDVSLLRFASSAV
jgi:hypothetical protein